jgi:hypothetical protein
MATQVKLNTRTLQQILRGEVGTIRKDLDRRADRVAGAAGSGYSAEGWVGRFRYRQNVSSDQLVKVSQSPLLAALDAARGAK